MYLPNMYNVPKYNIFVTILLMIIIINIRLNL